MAFDFELSEKVISQRVLQAAGTVIGTVIGVTVLSFIGIKIGDALIDRVFRPKAQKLPFDEKKILTLRTLAKSILRYTTYFLAGFTVLVQIAGGVANLKGFLAGAGILGLAVGFGAQSLVKDVITGFFILLEGQYAVGEYITTGTFSGIVEEVGLRVTRLRDWGGEYHIIPNGQITAVTNFSRGDMRALVDVGIAYGEDIERALLVMNTVVNDLARDMADIIVEGPEVLGVVAFGPDEVTLRAVARTKPMEQWQVERELRKRFKEAFDQQGIEIPYPRQIIVKPGPEGQPGAKNQKMPVGGE